MHWGAQSLDIIHDDERQRTNNKKMWIGFEMHSISFLMRTQVVRKWFSVYTTGRGTYMHINTQNKQTGALTLARYIHRTTGTNTYNTTSRAVLLKYSAGWYSADDKYRTHKARACPNAMKCNAPESFLKSCGRSGKSDWCETMMNIWWWICASVTTQYSRTASAVMMYGIYGPAGLQCCRCYKSVYTFENNGFSFIELFLQ